MDVSWTLLFGFIIVLCSGCVFLFRFFTKINTEFRNRKINDSLTKPGQITLSPQSTTDRSPAPDRSIIKIISHDYAEILLIILWALFIGRNYLNFDPMVIPAGFEFGIAVQENYNWNNLFICGTCVFWNGSVQGGAPAFGDIYSSWLHPLVAIPTWIFGTVNGIKISLILSFITAGIAQWWLARVVKVGRLSRIWMSLLAVCGGHITTRMELGTAGLVISVAACSLVFAPLLDLALKPTRRKAVILGIVLGLAFLSGQGYIVVGLVGCVLPAVAIFFIIKYPDKQNLLKELAFALLLAILLASIFFIPAFHLLPEISKGTDFDFHHAQTILYIPLNLVISSVEYYQSDSLEKMGYPFATGIYLGWIPVILALISIRKINKKNSPIFLFLGCSFALNLLVSSSLILKGAVNLFPELYSIRFPQLISSLTGPIVLALSCFGLDCLLNYLRTALTHSKYPFFASPRSQTITISVFLLPFILLSLRSLYTYSDNWLQTEQLEQAGFESIELLRTGTTQWVDVPFPYHFWYIPALEKGFKLSKAVRPWTWNEHELPPAAKLMTYDMVDPGDPNIIAQGNGLTVLNIPETDYAHIAGGAKTIPCAGHATGGFIDITCPDSGGGILTVYENSWDGWYARVDGQPAQLLENQWLSVNLGPGPHTITFRYQPRDVWVGMALSLIGILLCFWLWRTSPPLSEPESILETEYQPSTNLL